MVKIKKNMESTSYSSQLSILKQVLNWEERQETFERLCDHVYDDIEYHFSVFPQGYISTSKKDQTDDLKPKPRRKVTSLYHLCLSRILVLVDQMRLPYLHPSILPWREGGDPTCLPSILFHHRTKLINSAMTIHTLSNLFFPYVSDGLNPTLSLGHLHFSCETIDPDMIYTWKTVAPISDIFHQHLVYLDLSCCKITCKILLFNYLSRLTKLKLLDLSFTDTTQMDLYNLTRPLAYTYPDDTSVSYQKEGLTSLTHLNLKGNRQLNDQVIQIVARFPNLVYVDLSFTSITSECLRILNGKSGSNWNKITKSCLADQYVLSKIIYTAEKLYEYRFDEIGKQHFCKIDDDTEALMPNQSRKFYEDNMKLLKGPGESFDVLPFPSFLSYEKPSSSSPSPRHYLRNVIRYTRSVLFSNSSNHSQTPVFPLDEEKLIDYYNSHKLSSKHPIETNSCNNKYIQFYRLNNTATTTKIKSSSNCRGKENNPTLKDKLNSSTLVRRAGEEQQVIATGSNEHQQNKRKKLQVKIKNKNSQSFLPF